jgi:uncharacterized membrane protein YjjB (DUF3815 family)
LLVLAAQHAHDFLGKEFNFEPAAGPFIALGVVGFVAAVLGHVYKSRTVVIAGIVMVFAAVLLLPLGLYLSGRG